ncbi:MAG: response regulator transcription factor [Oscillospiraceae bacterium]|nr:response regulator transcription factor [Oscillospiraceae bacterium]
MKKTVLCVEDELDVLENNRVNLENAGYTVLTAENLKKARKTLSETTPDIIILDIMLPDGNGLEYLKELRTEGNDIPIIMLTAWNRGEHSARGIEMGADDYIGKPFVYADLLARVKKVLEQTERIPKLITRGALSLDLISLQAFINGENMLLTQKEFSLLLLFVRHENRIIRQEYLYEQIWNLPYGNTDKTLKSHLSRLRKSLTDTGYTIETVRGEGYVFKKG